MNTKLTPAFNWLRCEGYFAEENFQCCQTCGWAATPKLDKVAFYHAQDADQLERTGKCCIAWSGDAKQICDIFHEFGTATTWDGPETTRIEVDARRAISNII